MSPAPINSFVFSIAIIAPWLLIIGMTLKYDVPFRPKWVSKYSRYGHRLIVAAFLLFVLAVSLRLVRGGF